MMRMHTKIFLIGLALVAVATLVRASEPEVVEVEMPGEPGERRLVITLLSGSLNITGTDGDQLRLIAAPEEETIATLDATEEDPRARGLSKLTGVATQMLIRDRDGIAEVEIGSQLLQSDGVVITDMAIELPRDVELDITAQYAQDIQVSGMSGAITVRSTDAHVTVDRATGPLQIQTVSGWIRLFEITGPVEANTSFGGIEAVLSEVSPDKSIWLTAAVDNRRLDDFRIFWINARQSKTLSEEIDGAIVTSRSNFDCMTRDGGIIVNRRLYILIEVHGVDVHD